MAGNTTTIQQLKQAETDIAVLQVRFNNLDEKISEVRQDLAEIRDDLEKDSEKHVRLIKEFQQDNVKAHKEMASKISALEKWRWMLMGAGVVIGGLGWETIGRLFSIV